MRILIVGASGYIGSRLLALLVKQGHEVYAFCRRKPDLLIPKDLKSHVHFIRGDLLRVSTLKVIPKSIDAAYYLVHSMKEHAIGFFKDEANSASNFKSVIEKTDCKQIIYLAGLAVGKKLSEHMQSRVNVESILEKSVIPTTVLRAGIIIGSGSASFEIIRDLVEKLPIMIAPKWVNNRCQPIAIRDVLFYLTKVLSHKQCLGQVFEIGGPEKIRYKEMLLRFAKVRGLHRKIIQVPLLTPRLSSYWLFFITSTPICIARALVDSLKLDAICLRRSIKNTIKHECLKYEESLKEVFTKVEQHPFFLNWKDANTKIQKEPSMEQCLYVPKFGCIKELTISPYKSKKQVVEKLWSIGLEKGWYYLNWVWIIRGTVDFLLGGVGFRQGRPDPTKITSGDRVDFWRVLFADQKQGRMILYVEMTIPGECWVEYSIKGRESKGELHQTVTFRPKGVWGRFYWYVLLPFRFLIFRGLCEKITQKKKMHKK